MTRTGRPSKSGHPTKGVTVRIPIYLLSRARAEDLDLSCLLTVELMKRYATPEQEKESEILPLMIDVICLNWKEFDTYLSLEARFPRNERSLPPWPPGDMTPDPWLAKRDPRLAHVSRGFIRKNFQKILEKAEILGLIKPPRVLPTYEKRGHLLSSKAVHTLPLFNDKDVVQ